MVPYVSAVVIVALLTLIGWLAYLRFCRFLVLTTKESSSLEHGAEFARGYRAILLTSVGGVLMKTGHPPKGGS